MTTEIEDLPCSSPLLTVNGIEVIYNHVILVLKGVSLTVPEGGSSPCSAQRAGKTTRCAPCPNLAARRARRGHQGLHRVQATASSGLTAYELVRRGVVAGDGGPAAASPT